MTTKHDTGGPAFPARGEILMGIGSKIAINTEGMTLLDWFAGQALATLPSNQKADYLAKEAYRTAKAMLAEKRRREGE